MSLMACICDVLLTQNRSLRKNNLVRCQDSSNNADYYLGYDVKNTLVAKGWTNVGSASSLSADGIVATSRGRGKRTIIDTSATVSTYTTTGTINCFADLTNQEEEFYLKTVNTNSMYNLLYELSGSPMTMLRHWNEVGEYLNKYLMEFNYDPWDPTGLNLNEHFLHEDIHTSHKFTTDTAGAMTSETEQNAFCVLNPFPGVAPTTVARTELYGSNDHRPIDYGCMMSVIETKTWDTGDAMAVCGAINIDALDIGPIQPAECENVPNPFIEETYYKMIPTPDGSEGNLENWRAWLEKKEYKVKGKTVTNFDYLRAGGSSNGNYSCVAATSTMLQNYESIRADYAEAKEAGRAPKRAIDEDGRVALDDVLRGKKQPKGQVGPPSRELTPEGTKGTIWQELVKEALKITGRHRIGGYSIKENGHDRKGNKIYKGDQEKHEVVCRAIAVRIWNNFMKGKPTFMVSGSGTDPDAMLHAYLVLGFEIYERWTPDENGKKKDLVIRTFGKIRLDPAANFAMNAIQVDHGFRTENYNNGIITVSHHSQRSGSGVDFDNANNAW